MSSLPARLSFRRARLRAHPAAPPLRQRPARPLGPRSRAPRTEPREACRSRRTKLTKPPPAPPAPCCRGAPREAPAFPGEGLPPPDQPHHQGAQRAAPGRKRSAREGQARAAEAESEETCRGDWRWERVWRVPPLPLALAAGRSRSHCADAGRCWAAGRRGGVRARRSTGRFFPLGSRRARGFRPPELRRPPASPRTGLPAAQPRAPYPPAAAAADPPPPPPATHPTRQVIGSPSEEDIQFINSDKARRYMRSLPHRRAAAPRLSPGALGGCVERGESGRGAARGARGARVEFGRRRLPGRAASCFQPREPRPGRRAAALSEHGVPRRRAVPSPAPAPAPALPRRSSRLDFAKLYSNSSPATVDLLSRMLVFNPNERITVDEARCPAAPRGGARAGRARACFPKAEGGATSGGGEPDP